MSGYLTAVAAAKALHSSRSHIYELVKQYRLKSIIVEGKYVVTEESVERYKKLKSQYEAIHFEMQKAYYQNGRS